ncbi:hypothetical protein NQ314_008718 [Rhamnusium bicolor]|uniref:SET and MYND domain-containing protein 4 n=1 Tax=Rhamnusium bicolor TaxID=1586634 RepID=A0AAV8Y7K5_9CUCU|nr:hypothetical protein NQ314_008718 [Rhamnusium bicolor]
MSYTSQAAILKDIKAMLCEPGLLINTSHTVQRIDVNCIDYVYKLLTKSREFQKLMSQSKPVKSNDTSVKYRMSGNEMYRNKIYLKALKYYTRSINFAENKSSYLGLAYANRSAVLFEKKYYKECLEDIERALENKYPDHLKQKLLKRQQEAEHLKKTQKPLHYHHITPRIINKNALIDAASDALEIQINEKFGRHIVATKDIKIGDVIAVEKPFAHLLFPKNRWLHCHECLNLCYNMIPCGECTTALYCSKECRTKAFTSYHRFECDFVEYFHKHPLLFMKMVVVGLQNSDINSNAADNLYCSNRFKEIKALTTNEDKKKDESLLLAAAMASIGFYCLKSNQNFSLEFDLENNESLIKELLYKCALNENCNGFFVAKYHEHRSKSEHIGEAVYSFISLFNHSCVPNCDTYFYGSHVVVRARANIKKGDQCMISYG